MLNMIFGNVTRLVRADSSEAKESPKAQEAIDKEIENIRSKDALFWEETYEESEAKELFPESEFVDGMMILGEKYAELEEALREWKGRFVILGNNVRSAFGEKVYEEVIQTIPSTMAEARLLFYHRSRFEKGVLLHADGDGAYFTSILGGNRKFLRMKGALRKLLPKNKRHL
jgi:hypothetical protein